MMRHVAADFFAYRPEDRQKLYEQTVKQAELDIANKVRTAQIEAEHHEDMVDVENTKAKRAAKSGDVVAAERHKKKAASEDNKAKKSRKKVSAAEKDTKLKETHLRTAAAKLGITPRKAGKMLTKPEIEGLITKLLDASETETLDPVAKKPVPMDMASMGAMFLQGVIDGMRDPFQPIRQQMIADGNWEEEDEEIDEPEEEVLSDMDDDDYEDYDDTEDLESLGINEIDDDDMN
jgi:hypothetical protein